MKRFFILTIILIAALFYFGFPGTSKQEATKVDKAFTESNTTYSPWSNKWLEKIHRSFNFKEATIYQLKKKKITPLSDISPSVQQATLAMEDRKFYNHGGFDWEGILRAGLVNLQKGEIEEGASTITQQVVKNIFLTQEQNWSRKTEELVLALQLESTFSKEEILSIYLSTIYFGSNAYGIEEASQIYFDKDPTILTLGESAMLIGVIPAPSIYSPHTNFQLAKSRQEIVLSTMQKLNMITPKQATDAKNEKLYIKPL